MSAHSLHGLEHVDLSVFDDLLDAGVGGAVHARATAPVAVTIFNLQFYVPTYSGNCINLKSISALNKYLKAGLWGITLFSFQILIMITYGPWLLFNKTSILSRKGLYFLQIFS